MYHQLYCVKEYFSVHWKNFVLTFSEFTSQFGAKILRFWNGPQDPHKVQIQNFLTNPAKEHFSSCPGNVCVQIGSYWFPWLLRPPKLPLPVSLLAISCALNFSLDRCSHIHATTARLCPRPGLWSKILVSHSRTWDVGTVCNFGTGSASGCRAQNLCKRAYKFNISHWMADCGDINITIISSRAVFEFQYLVLSAYNGHISQMGRC